MRIPVNPTDRRSMFRSTLGRWVEDMMQRTEERVVTKRYLRPPGALPEVGFLAACTRCGLCVDPCPPRAIRLATSDGGLAAGTPYIDVHIEACIACADMPCARACPTGALTLPPGGWTGYRLAALELVTDIVRSEPGPLLIDAVDSRSELLRGLTEFGWIVERPFQRMRFGIAATKADVPPMAGVGPEFG